MESAIKSSLITDRSKAHVDRLRLLNKIGWDKMTASQRAEYTGVSARGAYNYTDLNRVESAVAELSDHFGLGLATKTDWTWRDLPTQSHMSRFLENVKELRAKCVLAKNLPHAPESMNNLSFEAANDIEKILLAAYDAPRQAEMMIDFSAEGWPDTSTFQWKIGDWDSGYVVMEQNETSRIYGGVLHVDYDPAECNNWNLNLYLFSPTGYASYQTDERHDRTGIPYRWGESPPHGWWESPGSGNGCGTVVAPFTVSIPEGYRVMACMYRGANTTGTVANDDFRNWVLRGGVTFTITKD